MLYGPVRYSAGPFYVSNLLGEPARRLRLGQQKLSSKLDQNDHAELTGRLLLPAAGAIILLK